MISIKLNPNGSGKMNILLIILTIWFILEPTRFYGADLSKKLKKETNPVTGLESTNLGDNLSKAYKDPAVSAIPAQDLQQLLPNESQYDTQLTGADIIRTQDDPKLLEDLRSSKQRQLILKRLRIISFILLFPFVLFLYANRKLFLGLIRNAVSKLQIKK